MTACVRLAPVQGSPFYFVLCDYGADVGRAFSTTDPDLADRERVLTRLMRGGFRSPVQVIEVDLPNGTVRDASVDFAEDILKRIQLDDLPEDVAMFVSLRNELGL